MIVSVIGTRPQYIKVKPIYDYCKKNGIDHQIWDSGQHYSPGMSDEMVKSLNIEIDRVLSKETGSLWVSEVSQALGALSKEDVVLIYGDTRTSVVAAMGCNVQGIKFAHVEAGARCGVDIPEEINRKYVDGLADMHFCSQQHHLQNVRGIYTGDLEYDLLNRMGGKPDKQGFGVMTVHRQENMELNRMRAIIQLVEDLAIPIYLPIHHRLKLQGWWQGMYKPVNLIIDEPYTYPIMQEHLRCCDFILTDSGGVSKVAPFWGKRALILRNEMGWDLGDYAMLWKGDSVNQWLNSDVDRDKSYLMADKPASQIIIECTEKLKETEYTTPQ